MIRLLLRRDPGTNNLIAPILIGLGVAVLLRLMSSSDDYGLLFDPANRNGVWFVQHFVIWSVLLAGLIGSQFWLRTARIYMALPIPARTLWSVRMAAIGIGCGAMILGITLINGVQAVDGRLGLVAQVWGGALRLGAVFALMIALLQAPDVRLRKLERTPFYIAYTVILWIGGLLVLCLGPRSPWFAAPLLALTAWVGWRTWRAIPPSFRLEGVGPDGSPETTPSADVPLPHVSASTGAIPVADRSRAERAYPLNGPSGRLLHTTLFRLMHSHWLGWLFLSLLAIYGLALIIQYFKGSDMILSLIYFFVFGFGSWNQAVLRIHPVDAWPLSRRLIFAHALLPLVAMYLLGTGLGVLVYNTVGKRAIMVEVADDGPDVPYEFRAIATDGRIPEVVSPWGEAHTPAGTPVLPVLDTVIYNPYAYGDGASPRFRAWQTDRAVAAVFGDPEPETARYFGPATAEFDSTCCGFDLEAARGRTSPLRDRVMALLVVLFTLIELPLLMFGSLSFDRRALDWIRDRAATVGALFPIVGLGVLVLSAAVSNAKLWAQAAWLMIRLRRIAESLPLDTTQLWGVVAGILALAYLIVQQRFVRLEASQLMLRKQRMNDV